MPPDWLERSASQQQQLLSDCSVLVPMNVNAPALSCSCCSCFAASLASVLPLLLIPPYLLPGLLHFLTSGLTRLWLLTTDFGFDPSLWYPVPTLWFDPWFWLLTLVLTLIPVSDTWFSLPALTTRVDHPHLGHLTGWCKAR